MIELLCDAISNGILSLEFLLESQLVLPKLNGVSYIRDPTLLQRFLWVILLEQKFEHINAFIFLGSTIMFLILMQITF